MIYLISGKARHGKTTTAGYIKDYYDAKGIKSIDLQYAKYIKDYTKNITDWDGREETKPREFMQQLGTEFIRHEIDDDFFVRRIAEDILVYQKYFDVISISDVRLIKEITYITDRFDNIRNIHIVRPGYIDDLTGKQKRHSTEVGLDGYNKYDYIINNDGTLEDLKSKVYEMIDGWK